MCGAWPGGAAEHWRVQGVSVHLWKEAGGVAGKQIRADSHHTALPHLEATLHPVCSVLSCAPPAEL